MNVSAKTVEGMSSVRRVEIKADEIEPKAGWEPQIESISDELEKIGLSYGDGKAEHSTVISDQTR